jgi:hypothetical protein
MPAQNDNKDVPGYDFDSTALGHELGLNGALRRPLTIRIDLAFLIAKKVASNT